MPKKTEPAIPTEWLYTVEGTHFFMLPLDLVASWEVEAIELGRVSAALATDCATWGDVYQLWPDGRHRIADQIGIDVDDVYDDDEPFDLDDYPGPDTSVHDIRYGMLEAVPDAIVDEFGDVIELMMDGEFLELDGTRSTEILETCAALGLNLVRSDRLDQFIVV